MHLMQYRWEKGTDLLKCPYVRSTHECKCCYYLSMLNANKHWIGNRDREFHSMGAYYPALIAACHAQLPFTQWLVQGDMHPYLEAC